MIHTVITLIGYIISIPANASKINVIVVVKYSYLPNIPYIILIIICYWVIIWLLWNCSNIRLAIGVNLIRNGLINNGILLSHNPLWPDKLFHNCRTLSGDDWNRILFFNKYYLLYIYCYWWVRNYRFFFMFYYVKWKKTGNF